MAFKFDIFLLNPYWNFNETVALDAKGLFFAVIRYRTILSKSRLFYCGNFKFSTVPLPKWNYKKTRITVVTCMCMYNFKDWNKLVAFSYMHIKPPCWLQRHHLYVTWEWHSASEWTEADFFNQNLRMPLNYRNCFSEHCFLETSFFCCSILNV